MTKVFGGSLASSMNYVKGLVIPSLPPLPNFKSWKFYKSKKSLRDIAKRKMVNIKAQIRSNIQNHLGNYETATMIAIICLDSTSSFVTTILSFISDTHQELTDSDFSEEASWQLVT